MLIVNNVANVSTKIFAKLLARGKNVKFYQPETNATTKNRFKILIGRLLLPFFLMVKGRGHHVFYIHYAMFAKFLRFTHKDLIVHCHGTDLRENLFNNHRRATLSSLCRAKVILLSTPDLKQYLPKKYQSKAYFLPNPVDTQTFSPAINDNRKTGLSVFFLSKLDKTKGIDKFFPLIDYLCGKAEIEHVYVFKHGNAVPNKLPNHDKIVWLDKLTYLEMVDLMQKQDIAIGQMELGAIGMSELESLSCGVPTLAYFKYNELYPEASPVVNVNTTKKAIVELENLISNKENREILSKNSRHWIEKYHDLDKICDQLESILKDYRIKY